MRVSLFTARDIYENGDGIAVTFDEEEMPVRGRELNEDYQVLAKRLRESEERVLRMLALEAFARPLVYDTLTVSSEHTESVQSLGWSHKHRSSTSSPLRPNNRPVRERNCEHVF
jgi:hypothetical protein